MLSISRGDFGRCESFAAQCQLHSKDVPGQQWNPCGTHVEPGTAGWVQASWEMVKSGNIAHLFNKFHHESLVTFVPSIRKGKPQQKFPKQKKEHIFVVPKCHAVWCYSDFGENQGMDLVRTATKTGYNKCCTKANLQQFWRNESCFFRHVFIFS